MRLLIIELSHSAGTRTVLHQIIPRLANLCEAVVYCGHNSKAWSSYPGVQSLSFGDLISLFHVWTDAMRKRLLLAAGADREFWIYIERLIKQRGITHVFLPWLIGHSIPRLSVPAGGMLMDLLWRHFPEDFSSDVTIESTLLKNLSHIDVAFPVSESTSADIQAVWSSADVSVVTVPHAAQLLRSESAHPVSSAGLTVPFFLYPAQATANKNHLCLFEAVHLLASRGITAPLVCTSQAIARLRNRTPLSRHEQHLCDWLDQHQPLLNDSIQLMGSVSWSELDALYKQCHAVVLPSAYEGFGLPLVEAFERNTPIICSGIAPFREQIQRYGMGGRVTIVDPVTPSSLAEAMEHHLHRGRVPQLTPDELQAKLSRWTWDDAAKAYINALQSV